MDKNTLTGLVLIGILLTVFTFLNKPDEKELKEKQKQEQTKKAASTKKNTTTPTVSSIKNTKNVASGNVSQITEENKSSVNPTTQNAGSASKTKEQTKGKTSTIENENLLIELNTKGGIISAVYLKKYKSYTDFISNSKDNKLCLFKAGDNVSDIVFKDGN